MTAYEVNNAGGQIIVGRLNNPDNSAAWVDAGANVDVFNQKATYRYKREETPVKWSIAGANANITDVFNGSEASVSPAQFYAGPLSFDVKSMVSAWVAGTAPNAGLYITAGAVNPNSRMRGKYWSVVTERPKLTVVYNPSGSSSSSSSSSRSSSSSSSSKSSSSSSSSCRSSSSSSSSKGSSSSCSSSSSCRSSSSSSRSSSSSSSSRASITLGNVFTSGDSGTLPGDDVNLSYAFSATDYTAVATDDGSYVATDGTNEFLVVMFKNTIVPGQPFTVTWNGKTNIAPTTSTVYLQILNRTTNTWETLISNNSTAANVDFTLAATKSTNVGDYIDTANQVSGRVYQENVYD